MERPVARKNLLLELTSEESGSATSEASARLGSAFTTRGASGILTESLDDLAARADEAKELEARLASGQVIVELDTALIEPSFVADRMAQNDDAYATLRAAIAAEGQKSPILLRPHPQKEGRYQVAFGHRRLRIAQELGRPVKAIVQSLSDSQLVLAQGQENSARADLSFIERARFARRLEDMGYGRDLIMSALAVDKYGLSRMISVTMRIPLPVIDAIGPAPGIGRDRWVELAEHFQEGGKEAACLALLESQSFLEADSDDRFAQVLYFILSSSAVGQKAGNGGQSARHREVQEWGPAANNRRVVSLTYNSRVTTLSIDRRLAPDFGEFLLSQMDRLFAEYSSARTSRADVDLDSAVNQRAKKTARTRSRAERTKP
jgi:ParB family transcriptional regulator, chromosome partitioning protein